MLLFLCCSRKHISILVLDQIWKMGALPPTHRDQLYISETFLHGFLIKVFAQSASSDPKHLEQDAVYLMKVAGEYANNFPKDTNLGPLKNLMRYFPNTVASQIFPISLLTLSLFADLHAKTKFNARWTNQVTAALCNIQPVVQRYFRFIAQQM